MKFGAVPLADAIGAILAHGVKHNDGVFKKGRVLSSEDVAALGRAGIARVTVARLEANDVPEDEAARLLAVGQRGRVWWRSRPLRAGPTFIHLSTDWLWLIGHA
jgi:hypothetical protein